ncbi:hypothetical protein HanIR_Chr12g0591161 [Helianthus annuus]|nr:hypothetical protein HanIR_Chr12g0591161 [Helianthus annuus]
MCGDVGESVNHLFISCSVANIIWMQVSEWCKIDLILAFSYRDLIEIHRSITEVKSKKKIVQAIILISCWSIWKMRNEVTFSQKMVSLSRLLAEIKLLSSLWVKKRMKAKEQDWFL